MPDIAYVALVVVIWLGIGLATAIAFFARAGRRNPLWFVVTCVLGPLMTPIAYEMSRDVRTEVVDREPDVPLAESDGRTLTVLVAVDESAESRQALDYAAVLLSERIRRLVLLHVLDLDEISTDRDGARRNARRVLEEAAAGLPEGLPGPCLEVAAGRAPDALLDLAEQEGADILVVGHRGEGLDTRVVGSVADEVVRRSAVPVLVGGAVAAAG